jgi:hypothetical protein
MADAAAGAKAGQKGPECSLNIERMPKGVLGGNGQVLLRSTGIDAIGLDGSAPVTGPHRGMMNELGRAALATGKAVAFQAEDGAIASGSRKA